MVGFELTVRETQFAIHFDNFTEHFFQVLSLNKDKFGEVRNEVTLVLVKKQISCICYITVTLARGFIQLIAVLALVL